MKRTYLFFVMLVVLSTQSFSNEPTSSMLNPVKSVKLPNNVTLQYVERGDSTGTPVIFLHGLSDSWHSYDLVLPYLPKSYHAFAISVRGHGDSDEPASGYHPDDLAADVAAFIKTLKIGPAVIVGHSMGATITQSFSIHYPQLTKAIVLIGSFASFHDKPGVIEMEKVILEFKDGADKNFAREFQQSTLNNPVPPAFFETMVNESLKLNGNTWKQLMKGFNAADYREKLKTVKKPALIIWGNKDAFVPEADQKILVSAINGSKLLVYKETGHAVHWEKPEQFSRDLAVFINGL